MKFISTKWQPSRVISIPPDRIGLPQTFWTDQQAQGPSIKQKLCQKNRPKILPEIVLEIVPEIVPEITPEIAPEIVAEIVPKTVHKTHVKNWTKICSIQQ